MKGVVRTVKTAVVLLLSWVQQHELPREKAKNPKNSLAESIKDKGPLRLTG